MAFERGRNERSMLPREQPPSPSLFPRGGIRGFSPQPLDISELHLAGICLWQRSSSGLRPQHMGDEWKTLCRGERSPCPPGLPTTR